MLFVLCVLCVLFVLFVLFALSPFELLVLDVLAVLCVLVGLVVGLSSFRVLPPREMDDAARDNMRGRAGRSPDRRLLMQRMCVVICDASGDV